MGIEHKGLDEESGLTRLHSLRRHTSWYTVVSQVLLLDAKGWLGDSFEAELFEVEEVEVMVSVWGL